MKNVIVILIPESNSLLKNMTSSSFLPEEKEDRGEKTSHCRENIWSLNIFIE